MSRPEDLPRAASPMKRRAGSLPSDDSPDAVDVDLHDLPPTANIEEISMVDSDIIQGLEDTVQDVHVDDFADDASTTAQGDDRDEEALDLLNLTMDQDSVYGTHVGSDVEDSAPAADNPGGVGLEAQEQGLTQYNAQGQDAVEGIGQANDSSTPNTDEAADSDARTAETNGTNTSVEEPVTNPSLLLGPKCTFGATPNNSNNSNQSGRSSPAPPPYSLRGRLRKGERVGLVGLGNLGNTCYMNSALQCIRSVDELTKYFLSGEHTAEVNRDNVLGHNGDVANAYAKLLHSIYHKQFATQSSVSPRNFKDTVGRYAPQFAGWQQQDTQEFLGFLLDGLQEDLSRVKKKPYIEKPDSTDEMVGNQELIRKMAAEVWDIHKKRDDSVIGDLFTGMYKSTLVCPDCEKVSITFEPFNNLTLPLPVRNTITRKVRYFPLNDRPVYIMVELDKAMTIKGLKNFISSRVGVPPERLFGAEEYRDRFFRLYEDNEQAWDNLETQSDHPCFFELEAKPTNTGGNKKLPYKGGFMSSRDELPPYEEDPAEQAMSQRMLVPVMHRFNPRSNNDSRMNVSRTSDKVGPPHFIVLTPAEARSEDAIRRKILEKVLTFTTHPEIATLTKATEDNPTEESNVDPALISVSDADSSGDGRVVAKSIEGEDDIVDVSMPDANQESMINDPVADEYPHLLRKFNTRRPDWVDPDVYLDGRLQTLFDMSFFAESSPVATSWTSYGNAHEKFYPRLTTRKPRSESSSEDEMPSPSGSGTASDESSTDEAPESVPTLHTTVTRMEEESSEEDDLPDIQNVLPHRGPADQPKLRGGRKSKQKKPRKTYGKKSRATKFNKPQKFKGLSGSMRGGGGSGGGAFGSQDDDPEEGSGADGGPLIRLGEGIIVEWDQGSWNSVYGLPFDSIDSADSAPYSTFTNHAVETLGDARLEAEQMARRARSKKNICLDDCLDEFEREEILSEEDKWYCPRCKEFCRAAKKFDLWHTPDVLIVHLKRFSSLGHRRDKIDAVVDFPIEGLDISTRVLEKKDGKQEVYDLIAIDDHMGGLGGGHYTAFAQNHQDKNWYKFDDTHVSGPIKNTQTMITSHAYLLFYRRRSDRPLGGPKLEEICRKFAAENEPEGDEEAAQISEVTEPR